MLKSVRDSNPWNWFLRLLAAIPLASVAKELPINWAELPPPYHSPSQARPPLLVPRPEGAVLELPAGFKVEEYLGGGFSAPRFMALGPSKEYEPDPDRWADFITRKTNRSDIMKETMVETQVTYTLLHEGKLYVIEHVPARACVETGKQFFAPETVEHVQALMQGRRLSWIETQVYEYA